MQQNREASGSFTNGEMSGNASPLAHLNRATQSGAQCWSALTVEL